MKKYHFIEKQLLEELDTLEESQYPTGKRANKALKTISNTIRNLRELVSTNGFSSQESEIRFFKQIKPNIYSQLIYYSIIIDIEFNRNLSSPYQLKQYINQRKQEFYQIFNSNANFVKYYRSGNTYSDHIYFTRKENWLPMHSPNMLHILELEFTCGFDHLVAHILAFDLFKAYLIARKKLKSNKQFHSPLIWTDNKTDLVELIYALHMTGAINHGKTNVKEICQIFEQLFNIEIGQIYRIFIEIRLRKTDRTRFIDKLSRELNKRMDDLDGN